MRRKTDQGQALIFVIAVTMILLMLGAIVMSTGQANTNSVEQNLVLRYSYRALEAGENYYMNAINANPDVINCSSTSTDPNCPSGLYDNWKLVPNTISASPHGASPEYYLLGNPKPNFNTATEVLNSVQIQVVGVSGRPGKYVYSSSVLNVKSENGFLDNIWWTNFEAFDPTRRVGSGNYSNCRYDWQPNSAGNNSYTGPGGSCNPVPFSSNDVLKGPLYSNDSMYVDAAGGSKPSFGTAGGPSTVVTADPYCQFVSLPGGESGNNDSSPTSSPGCQYAGHDYVTAGTYDLVNSSYDHPIEPPPPTDTQLGVIAKAGGCLYSGPTTITLQGSTMYVNSPDTPHDANGKDTSNDPSNPNTCLTNSQVTTYDAKGQPSSWNHGTPIPSNGVVFVQTATKPSDWPNGLPWPPPGANPFDDTANGGSYQQTVNHGCPSCYYGQSNQPDAEGDAFVYGNLSGQLTIGTQNNVIIDGNITYADCTLSTTSTPPGLCKYNPNTNTPSVTTNDSLGLIANNYVEVNHPVLPPVGLGNLLPICGTLGTLGIYLPPPFCSPTDASGSGSITIDAAILALNQSFVVNNYAAGSPEGSLNVNGAIAQFARGPVGGYNSSGVLTSGYTKNYTWDPRLPLYPPPSYLEPGTPAWGIGSSSVTVSGQCPPPGPYASTMPPLTCPTVPTS